MMRGGRKGWRFPFVDAFVDMSTWHLMQSAGAPYRSGLQPSEEVGWADMGLRPMLV
jgi:hypothetical protein